MYFIGLDIGSSFVKASLLDGDSGQCLAAASSPQQEMPISAPRPGWAEQDPDMWWENAVLAVRQLQGKMDRDTTPVGGVGIAYQMHGLVIVRKDLTPVRPAIIWCDSRAVETGRKAFERAGEAHCLFRLLNAPGNFTASKLGWVKTNEPQHYREVYKAMLPGDYIAMKLTGEINTTAGGLSEAILWDHQTNGLAGFLLESMDLSPSLLPSLVPAIGIQGYLRREAAAGLGLEPGIPVTYRTGDQPNNAFSLNVLEPGDIAATAGTSGVVYAVSDRVKYDPLSRVNTFLHVNHTPQQIRLGILLCINGTGIINAWMKRNAGGGLLSYDEMNEQAATVPPGSEGLLILPFGNGAERMLQNRDLGCRLSGLNFNTHRAPHLFRAAQEGVAFAFHHGMKIMKEIGVSPAVLRAGHSNLFLSPLFCETLSSLSNLVIELYDTDGSFGAARGAALGSGFYTSTDDCFKHLSKIKAIAPDPALGRVLNEVYDHWEEELSGLMKQP
jgi:xylulokinase